MKSGIYCIRNIINNKRYVGSTKDFETRKNQHFDNLRNNKHNKKFQNAFNKYGEENFVFEIIKRMKYSRHEIIKEEDYFMSFYDSKKNGYNIADASFGDCISGHPDRDEICKNISKGGKIRWSKISDEDKIEFIKNRTGSNNGMFGKKHSEKSKRKMSDSSKGIGKGKQRSEDANRKTGNTLSMMHKNGLLDFSGNKNPFYGKKHSEKSKRKMSDSSKGRQSPIKGKKLYLSDEAIKSISKGGEKRTGGNNGRSVKVKINGIIFDTKKEAQEYFCISGKVLTNRLKSDKYQNYQII